MIRFKRPQAIRRRFSVKVPQGIGGVSKEFKPRVRKMKLTDEDIRLMLNEAKLVEKNLRLFVKSGVTYLAGRAMMDVLFDIMSYALPRTPVDTGELRESATATIKPGRGALMLIGGGRKDGTAFVHQGMINRATLFGVKTLVGNIYYYREGTGKDKGLDVARWTHFDINYYGEDSPAARTFGTGPFYLSSAYNERIGAGIRLVKSAVAGNLMEIAVERATRLRRGKRAARIYGSTVEHVELVNRFDFIRRRKM